MRPPTIRSPSRKDRQIGIGRNSKPRAALNSPSGAVIAKRQSWLIPSSTGTTTSSMNDLLRRLASIISRDADPDHPKGGIDALSVLTLRRRQRRLNKRNMARYQSRVQATGVAHPQR